MGADGGLGKGLAQQAGRESGKDFWPGEKETRNVFLGWAWDGERMGRGTQPGKPDLVVWFVFTVVHTVNEFHP